MRTTRRAAIAGVLGAALCCPSANAATGGDLFSLVGAYDAFGVKRTGSRSHAATLRWIEGQLRARGFRSQRQRLDLDYFHFQAATARISTTEIPLFPHWWPTSQTIALERRLAPAGSDTDVSGAVVYLRAPRILTAGLPAGARELMAGLAQRGAAALILTTETPTGSFYAMNVDGGRERGPPIPIFHAPARYAAALESWSAQLIPISVRLRGQYRRARSNNVVAHRAGDGPRMVLSTPTSGWFRCGGERGPGVAFLMRLAYRYADLGWDITALATSGHELGHLGIEAALAADIPSPQAVDLWLHLGSSIACRQFQRIGEDLLALREGDYANRFFSFASELSPFAASAFASSGIRLTPIAADGAGALGELQNVRAAGYQAIAAFAGSFARFHTPEDDVDSTTPELLAAEYDQTTAFIDAWAAARSGASGRATRQ